MQGMIQSYLKILYEPFSKEIDKSLFAHSNEIYGELYYNSVVKLVKYLRITPNDHFLDIGSGLGKLIFQIFLTTPVSSCMGIEINSQRHSIASQVKNKLHQQLPDLFVQKRNINLIHADFLELDVEQLTNISIVYVCSTVFSQALLQAIGKKINSLPNVETVVSLRKLDCLNGFKLLKRLFLHGTWDRTICYLYGRKS